MVSRPAPPNSTSAPPWPLMVSLPPSPLITSLPDVPASWSGPLVPSFFIAPSHTNDTVDASAPKQDNTRTIEFMDRGVGRVDHEPSEYSSREAGRSGTPDRASGDGGRQAGDAV